MSDNNKITLENYKSIKINKNTSDNILQEIADKYLQDGFSWDAAWTIINLEAYKEWDLELCKNKNYDEAQIRQIAFGANYAGLYLNGLECPVFTVDASKYANPEYTWEKMMEIRHQLNTQKIIENEIEKLREIKIALDIFMRCGNDGDVLIWMDIRSDDFLVYDTEYIDFFGTPLVKNYHRRNIDVVKFLNFYEIDLKYFEDELRLIKNIYKDDAVDMGLLNELIYKALQKVYEDSNAKQIDEKIKAIRDEEIARECESSVWVMKGKIK